MTLIGSKTIANAVTQRTDDAMARQRALANKLVATSPFSGAQALLGGAQSRETSRKDRFDEFLSQFNFSESQRKDLEKQSKVLGDLEQVAKQAVRDQKGAATERVARIKQELEMLKRFAAIDPEGTAKRAAQLARELGAAAQQYASAGSAADAGAAAGATAGGEAAASADAAGAAPADVAASATAAVPTTAIPTESGTAVAVEAGETNKKPGEAPNATESLSEQAREKERAKEKEQAKAYGLSPEQQERMAEARGDVEFAAMVKDLAAQLKALIERGARAAREKGKDAEADNIANTGREGLRDAANAVTKIQGATVSAITGATGMIAPPAAIISIVA